VGGILSARVRAGADRWRYRLYTDGAQARHSARRAALFAANGFKEALDTTRRKDDFAALNASEACLNGSVQARQILDLGSPEAIAAAIKTAAAQATAEGKEAGAVLRELALIAAASTRSS
jgi:hypothetical protein